MLEFGTDGVRGVANVDLTPELVLALGRAAARMRRREFGIDLDLHLGRGASRLLAADLSVAYVRFNAEYTT